MEENNLNLSDEVLENLSVEEIAKLKIEIDELVGKMDHVIESCDETLKLFSDVETE